MATLSQSFSVQSDPFTNHPQNRRSFHRTRSPSNSSTPTLYRTRSLQRLSEEKKAKKVRFYRNGDRFHQGLVYAISSARFRSFEVLLADLTNRLADKANLPQGVRVVYSIDGKKKINSIEQLEQGESYVCASSDVFKKIDYAQNTNPNWCANVRTGSSLSLRLRQQERSGSWVGDDMRSCVSHETLCKANERDSRDFIRPKLVTFIRSGVKPRKAIRMLLNKKTAHSLEQVFNDVTKAIKLDTGAVRKIYTLQGKPVLSLEDFFGSEEIYIAYGHEKPAQDDFHIDSDEAKFIRPYQTSVPRAPRVTFQRKGSARLNQTADVAILRAHQTAKRTFSLRGSLSPRKTFSAPPSELVNLDDAKWPRQVSERYEVGDVIGDGNFAVVHDCVERSTGQKFALKIIDKSKCVGKEHMIFNEVSILRRIKHPNVVRLVQEFDTKEDIYMVMEFVNGGDLFDAISSASRYTERDASKMLHNLSSALAYLHKLRIVHRDIKPENLLVYEYADGSKALKLADFGLATSVTGPLYTVCGTPTYVAPEIILQTGYGVKVDVWAAGIITYILLCGFPPFRSESNSQEELFDEILMGTLRFPSPYWDHVSDSARNLIHNALNRNPGERSSAEEILQQSWVSDDIALDRDMKNTVSNKLSTLRPSEAGGSSSSKARKRRVNTGARVLALTPLDHDIRMLAKGCDFRGDHRDEHVEGEESSTTETDSADAF